jgi:hypothetical protein
MVARVVSQTLKHVWTVLQPLNLPMAVMGGIALARWQHVRATRDVDILLALGKLDLEAVLATLHMAGVQPKRSRAATPLGSLSIVQLTYELPETFLPVQVDLLIADSEYHQAALSRRIATCLPEMDLDVDVLTCEDLILHKLLAGRLIDLADAAALLRSNRGALDIPYLKQWTARLKLEAALADIWSEAFPGQMPPT